MNKILVVGCGHSGTSLMIRMLGTHSKIHAIPGETCLFLNSDLEFIKKNIENFDAEARKNDKVAWVEKTPKHIQEIQKILMLYPDIKIIAMIRDPRDVACSLKARGFTFQQGLQRWLDDNLALAENFDVQKIHLQKLEDLTKNPSEQLKKIFEFLDFPYEDVTKYHQKKESWYAKRIVSQKPKSAKNSCHEKLRNWQINQPLFSHTRRFDKEMLSGDRKIFVENLKRIYLVQEKLCVLYNYGILIKMYTFLKKIKEKVKRIIYSMPILKPIVQQRNVLLQQIVDMEMESRALQDFSQKQRIFQELFLSPWTDVWKDFNVKNNAKIPKLMENLKQGMDKESRQVVDTLWEKIIYLIPYNRYKKSFLYKISDFFTEKELEEQKKEIDLSKYKFPEGMGIEPQIFSTMNGLIFLPENIRDRIKNRIIIDGGAYIGDSALIFCEYGPLKVYAFEPVEFLYGKLKETIKSNNVERIVEPIKLGLGKVKMAAEIYGANSSASIHATQINDSQKIELTTVDDFLQEKKGVVGLIKLDVEGLELDVIKGSLQTIKEHKPILLISAYHRPEDFFYIKPLVESLNVGYKFMIRKTSPFRVTSETVLIGYVD